jgi:hypothetical protein
MPFPTGTSARAPPAGLQDRDHRLPTGEWLEQRLQDQRRSYRGFTSAYTKPKYTWNVNYYVGPENANTTNGIRNLIDTTLLFTPPGKFNAYINYDYGSNRDAS